MNLGRFETGRNRNRSGPVRPVTAVTGPVPAGFFNPGQATQNFQAAYFQAASDATRISHACDMSALRRIWSFPVPKGKRKQGYIL